MGTEGLETPAVLCLQAHIRLPYVKSMREETLLVILRAADPQRKVDDNFRADGGFSPLGQLLPPHPPPQACWETSRIGHQHPTLWPCPSHSLHGPVSGICCAAVYLQIGPSGLGPGRLWGQPPARTG